MANYKSIADYLQQKRNQANLTQEQLCQVLAAFSPEFSELDALAVSRWERGKVEPSLNRQLEIIRYFGDEAYKIFTSSSFSSKNLPSNQAMNKVLEARAKFKHYLGAHPYLPQSEENFEQITPPHPLTQYSAQHLSNYIDNLTFGYEQWDSAWLETLQNHPAAEVSYYFYLGQLAGHCFALKIKQPYFEKLLDKSLDETDICEEMLASNNEPASLYIYSIYTGRVNAITQVYENLFKAFIMNKSLSYIGIRIRRDIAFVMLENVPHSIESIGPPSDNRNVGIKHRGKRYQYVTCRIERQALFNSPVFLNILRSD
ncbi:hypothetical protein OAG1_08450 [Agarivorans sp. OAG1]|uniref:helix-turn-helix transcriptional regulator n=1 Tax=Agarivorans sp. OAG1 TaxID=3082387 RepID=UPI002B2E0440|nr:hypothetical protein OAG1_08450 [Agarivorans sp. OAG1]